MTSLVAPALPSTSTAVVEAVSDQKLLALAAETAATKFALVERDTLPMRITAELEELLGDTRDNRIDVELLEDDPAQAPEMRLRGVRERLRQAGRSLLAGHVVQPGPYGDELVLVIAMPTGVLRRAEVVCSLEAA